MNEERQEEEVYVQPNIDHELSKEKRQQCREIVREIKEFGVSQRQLLFLIHLLTMELENREVLMALTKAIGEVRNQIPAGNKLIVSEEKHRGLNSTKITL